MRAAITSIIFDFGGVLGLPQDAGHVEALASLCGLSVDSFAAAYRRSRLELDRGTLGPEEYWRGILALGKTAPAKDLLERLNGLDTRSWFDMDRGMLAWGAELRSAGFRTAILSNMPPDKLRFIRADSGFGWVRDFHAAVFSGDCGLVKPEPGIYALCLEKLGAGPEECLFIDDHEANVEAARRVGMAAIHFTSRTALLSGLKEYPGVPAARLGR